VDLLDLNVWFALLVPEHPFHPRARAYWEEASDPFLVRVTALGLLRLLMNAKAMDGKPLEVREAWEVYRELRLSSGVPLLVEPEGLADLVRGGFPPGSGPTPIWQPSLWQEVIGW
jgi:predicted nucleic acid-binding protein